MKIELKKYTEQDVQWPQSGYHIMAQYNEKEIIIYQSYKKEIGNFAVKNQFFGGAFSFDRMTWIKPNFLWMMYRNGWGTKEGQEVVLAINLKMAAFENYLQHAVYSSYNQTLGITEESWREQVALSSARLQWDPDHNPYGEKLNRRAIQIGLRNEFIKSFANEDIILIEDISDFVNEQYQFVQNRELEKLIVPLEKPLLFNDDKLNEKLKIKTN